MSPPLRITRRDCASVTMAKPRLPQHNPHQAPQRRRRGVAFTECRAARGERRCRVRSASTMTAPWGQRFNGRATRWTQAGDPMAAAGCQARFGPRTDDVADATTM